MNNFLIHGVFVWQFWVYNTLNRFCRLLISHPNEATILATVVVCENDFLMGF